MRRLWFILSLCFLLPLTTVPAFAQEQVRAQGEGGNNQKPVGASATEGNKQQAAAAKSARAAMGGEADRGTQKDGKTEIITDEKTNTVRILIGGKEILTIDADGLQVHGDVDYSGLLTDTGGESGKASPRQEAAQEAMGGEADRGTQKDSKPQIVTDDKNNTVRVLIGGKEVVTIDAKGLHVNGNVDHAGALMDTGGKP
jgi:hypothetical protein